MKSAGIIVYSLDHSYEKPCGCDETKRLGIFATRKEAIAVKKRLLKKPGFRKYPRNFHIDRTVIGRLGWKEGFVTVK